MSGKNAQLYQILFIGVIQHLKFLFVKKIFLFFFSLLSPCTIFVTHSLTYPP